MDGCSGSARGSLFPTSAVSPPMRSSNAKLFSELAEEWPSPPPFPNWDGSPPRSVVGPPHSLLLLDEGAKSFSESSEDNISVVPSDKSSRYCCRLFWCCWCCWCCCGELLDTIVLVLVVVEDCCGDNAGLFGAVAAAVGKVVDFLPYLDCRNTPWGFILVVGDEEEEDGPKTIFSRRTTTAGSFIILGGTSFMRGSAWMKDDDWFSKMVFCCCCLGWHRNSCCRSIQSINPPFNQPRSEFRVAQRTSR
mmetsp:Transcript_3936/g.9988  ORF Transcript_3936/g.9988 Transcript_3936/m.9988 type:complete len:248 (-) Transcript_3936:37-780(-)